jgi:multisite-specific tRNA:(cytosine-C5)-methyltransferase
MAKKYMCRTRLNLNADFPASKVLVRNPDGDAVRSLYLTNGIIKTIVEHNDYTRLRIINCGTKVFTKQDGGRGMDASFRVLGEGLPVVLPYIRPETIMDCDIGILKTLLSVYYPLCGTFPEPFKTAIEARGKFCGFFCRFDPQMLVTEPGSHVVRFSPGEWDSATYGPICICLFAAHPNTYRRLTHELFLPIWKSNVSLTLMIDKKAKRFAAMSHSSLTHC